MFSGHSGTLRTVSIRELWSLLRDGLLEVEQSIKRTWRPIWVENLFTERAVDPSKTMDLLNATRSCDVGHNVAPNGDFSRLLSIRRLLICDGTSIEMQIRKNIKRSITRFQKFVAYNPFSSLSISSDGKKDVFAFFLRRISQVIY